MFALFWKEKEITTEGGLNLKINYRSIKNIIRKLNKKIRTTLFIDQEKIKNCKKINANSVEIHTENFVIYITKKNFKII